MPRLPRELSDQARYELASLRGQGIVLTDDDIVLINALCWEIETPQARQELARGFPCRAGNAVLWPRTVQAVHWFDRIGCDLPDAEYALAYCMAFGRDKDLMLAGQSEVERWKKSLTCTQDELTDAMAEVIRQETKDPVPASPAQRAASVAELAMMMQAMHGGDIDQWEQHVSVGYLCSLVDAYTAQTLEGGLDRMLRDRANSALYYAVKKIKDRAGSGNGE